MWMKKKTEKNEDVEEKEPQTPPDPGESPDEGNVEATEPRDKAEDQLKRALADLANFRKRRFKDLEDARQRALEGLTAELLPVIDNFHLALAACDKQEGVEVATEAMLDGLKMVQGLLEDALKRHGLAEIAAQGEAFDPNKHEAVGIDSETLEDPGTITTVVLRGYTLMDRVIRPSKVIVASDAQEQPREPS